MVSIPKLVIPVLIGTFGNKLILFKNGLSSKNEVFTNMENSSNYKTSNLKVIKNLRN